ncbi:MAG TPA: Gfo/Idh/MocA family oxidoreductase, partial [Candidatus Limiplasma sp.]|nr:Gfo/Idh/MocA family oxidoreductase [Candidatus Limiplasma sp.]
MNIALVGLGGMGTVHYMNYQHIPGANVVAVVGTTEADRAKAGAWGVPIYPTLTELCGAQAVDLVDICAPTYLHRQLALESFALSKHTLTEKPVALR